MRIKTYDERHEDWLGEIESDPVAREYAVRKLLRLWAAIVLTALVIGFLLLSTMTASASTCETYDFTTRTFSGSGETLRVSWVTQDVHSLLWVQTGEYYGQDEYENTVSHEVPDGATEATICDDGTVSWLIPAADPMPVPVVVDIPAPQVDSPADPSEQVDAPLSDVIPWAPYEARI